MKMSNRSIAGLIIGYWRASVRAIAGLKPCARQDAEKNWSAFQADPERKKVKAESKANGALVDHIDRYFMDPTSFSALH
jgi:hypothetical protein